MREIVNICDYSNTIDKQISLLKLIRDLKKTYDVCISSHVPLPTWIVEEVDYYFFYKKNLLSQNPKFAYYKWYLTDTWKINYKPFFTHTSHTQAILSLVLPSLTFLKSLGYCKVHMIEYDTILKNFDEFIFNSKKLEEFDAVGYIEIIMGNNFENPLWFLGAYHALNLNSFTYEELSYDFDEIEKIMCSVSDESDENTHYEGEQVIFRKLYNNKKIFPQDPSMCYKSLDTNNQNIHAGKYFSNLNNFTVYLKDKTLWFFASNEEFTNVENIKIIIDDSKILNFNVRPRTWINTQIHTDSFEKIMVIFNDQDKRILNRNNPLDEALLNSVFIETF